MIAVAGLLALVGGAWGLGRSPLLDIDEIRVTGGVHRTPDEIVAASRLGKGDQLLDLDLGSVERSIAVDPWVASVEVRRDWPSAVEISVVEREPRLLVLGGDGALSVLASDATVLGPAETGSPDFLIVALPTGSLTPGERRLDAATVIELSSHVTADLRAWIELVEVAPDGTLTIDLVGGALARLGRPLDVAESLIGLATVLGRVELACITSIDVSVPDSPVVTRGPECEGSGA